MGAALSNVLGGIAGRALTPRQPQQGIANAISPLFGQQSRQIQNVPNQQAPFNGGGNVFGQMPQLGGAPNQPQGNPFGMLGNFRNPYSTSNPLVRSALGLFNRLR